MIFLTLAPITSIETAFAGVCESQKQPLQQDADAPGIVRYNCSTNDRTPALRVSFYRLDEALAGSLVTGTPLPELETLLGPFGVIDNDVSREARAIFQYGTTDDYDFADDGLRWEIQTHGGVALEKKANDDNAPRKTKTGSSTRQKQIRHIWYISHSASNINSHFGLWSNDIILSEASNIILRTTHWPTGYKFSYSCGNDDFVSCTTIWRYVTASDFDIILRSMREFVRGMSAEQKRQDPTFRKLVPDYERNFQLYSYLSRRGMPNDFLFINTAFGPGCEGDGWSFYYSARPLKTDVALIENVTDRAVRIEDFLGLVSVSQNLRSAATSTILKTDNPVSLNLAPQTLAPGAKVVLPLRLRFAFHGEDMQSGDAKETYERIKSSEKSIFEHKYDST
jgi:hypothetical protein